MLTKISLILDHVNNNISISMEVRSRSWAIYHFRKVLRHIDLVSGEIPDAE